MQQTSRVNSNNVTDSDEEDESEVDNSDCDDKVVADETEGKLAPEDDFKGRTMLRAATCVQAWNCLHEDGLEDDPGEVDGGWLAALHTLSRAIKVAVYAPTSVLHRFISLPIFLM